MGGIFLLAFFGVILFSLWRILPRAGLSPWWSLAALIPFVGLPGLLFVLAMRPWPGDDARLGSGMGGS